MMSRPEGIEATEDDCFVEAASWYAKWRDASDSGLPADDVDRWADWSAVPSNKLAYDAVELIARTRFQLEAPPLPTPEELAADDSDEIQFPVAALERRPSRLSAIRWRRVAFVALAAALAAVAFTPVLHWFHLDRAEPVHVVATTAGELKQITLPDGSKVTLGAKTEVSVHYGQCLRTIMLNSGEALFTVARNPGCPFIVIAGDGAITAVGTEFSVRRTLDRVTVQVSEGAVNVQPREALASVPWPKDLDVPNVTWPDAKLAQGQEVTYHGNQSRSPVESEDAQVATAWLDGRRVYHHEPLSYLIADINRYFEEPIEMDHDVGDLQFTGLVYESQIEQFVQDLEVIFPVKVSRAKDNHFVISSRNAGLSRSPTMNIQ